MSCPWPTRGTHTRAVGFFAPGPYFPRVLGGCLLNTAKIDIDFSDPQSSPTTRFSPRPCAPSQSLYPVHPGSIHQGHSPDFSCSLAQGQGSGELPFGGGVGPGVQKFHHPIRLRRLRKEGSPQLTERDSGVLKTHVSSVFACSP